MGILQGEAESVIMKLYSTSLQLPMFIFCLMLVPETVQSLECGFKKSVMRGHYFMPGQGQDYVLNGQDAEPNEWPWMAGIVGPSISCGGSVIGSKWIITAAHCLVTADGSPLGNAKDLKIILGLHYTNKSSDKAEVYNVDYFIAHEDYIRYPCCSNDIAVIKVSKSIDLSQYTPVCLPGMNEDFTGFQATATGWGVESYTEDGHPQHPDVLQEVSLTIKKPDAEDCGLMENGKLCVSGSDANICNGDSGGPLTVERNGRHTLVGITSSTYEPCDGKSPSHFANVSYYRDWIKEKTCI